MGIGSRLGFKIIATIITTTGILGFEKPQIHAQYQTGNAQQVADLSNEISSRSKGLVDIDGFNQLFSGTTSTTTKTEVKVEPINIANEIIPPAHIISSETGDTVDYQDLDNNKGYFNVGAIDGIQEVSSQITKMIEKNLIIKDRNKKIPIITTGTITSITGNIQQIINKKILKFGDKFLRKGERFAITGAAFLSIENNEESGSTSGSSLQKLFINKGNKKENNIKGRLILSGIQEIIVRKGIWDEILLAPEQVPTAIVDTLGQEGLPNNWKDMETFTVGSTGASLGASGANFLVEYKVEKGEPGMTLDIYRSNDGTTRNINTPDKTCKLDENNICSFYTDHFTTFTVGGTLLWNNYNFIDSGFWDAGPTSNDIIKAVYGTSLGDTTIYTSGWSSNNCNPANISVIYINPGIDTIPNKLVANTIYILNGGSYITNNYINFNGNCITLIGKGKVTLYSVGYLPQIIYNVSKSNLIVDNINIDGESNGSSFKGDRNGFGIFSNGVTNSTYNNITTNKNKFVGFYAINDSYDIFSNISSSLNGVYGVVSNTSTYTKRSNISVKYNFQGGLWMQRGKLNTFSKIYVYENLGSYAITISVCSYNTFDKIFVYNNSANGIINTNQSNRNTFNNMLVDNNNGYGMVVDTSSSASVNNTTFANNDNVGFGLTNTNSGIILNNVIAYNNISYGLSLGGSSINIIANNIKSFNNNSRGIYGFNNNLKIFGNNAIYGNGAGNQNITTTIVTTGTLTEGISLGRTEGKTTETGSIDCSVMTNAINGQNNTLLPTNTKCNLKGRVYFWNYASPITFVYGTGSNKQIQPIRYNTTSSTIEQYGSTGIDFFPNRNINEFYGECNDGNTTNGDGCDERSKVEAGYICTKDGCYVQIGDGIISTGELCDDGNSLNNDGCSLSGQIESGYICSGMPSQCIKYGDGIISTGELCDDGNILNNDGCSLSGQVESGYICSGIPSQCSLSKDITGSINFITKDYRTKNPNDKEVIKTLFDGGSSYTKYRSSNTCNIKNIRVIHLNPGINQIPERIMDNTIYILESGDYISQYQITYLSSCSAIIGKGEVNILSIPYLTISIALRNGSKQNIIDNININGEYNGLNNKQTKNGFGLRIVANSPNNTFNNISIGNHAYGVYINGSSNNNIFNNIKIFNNSNYGFYHVGPSYTIINNAYIFNNTIGLYLNGLYTATNNAYIFNNHGQGVDIGAGNFHILNNIVVFNNNGYGILAETSSNTFNNITTFNNNLYGIAQFPNTLTNNKFFGNMISLSNGSNNSNITTGKSEYITLNMLTGNIITTGDRGCETTGIPKNKQNQLLLDPTNNCGSRGYLQLRSGKISDSDFIYPSNAKKQDQPLRYNNSNVLLRFGTIGNEYNPNQIIGQAFGQNISTELPGVCNDNNTTNGDGCSLSGQIESGYICIDTPSVCQKIGELTNITTGYIDDYFWTKNPSNFDIIQSIFGNGSIYNKRRSYNYCSKSNFSIQYINPGINKIPRELSGNTIYILNSGNHIIGYGSGIIINGNCSAIIGKGNTVIYSSGQIYQLDNIPYISYATINLNYNNNLVIENIKVNGGDNGPNQPRIVSSTNPFNIRGPSVSNSIFHNVYSFNNPNPNYVTTYLIYLYNYGGNNLFSSVYTYNGTSHGLRIDNGKNNQLEYIYSFNILGEGITIYGGSNNDISNSFTFNNGSYGINTNTAYQTSINNSISANNGAHGIYNNASNYSIINNTLIYNNYMHGIRNNSNVYSNIYNNIFSFNNMNNGIYNTITSNKYYGYMKIFDNGTNTNTLTQGAGDLIYLGINTGNYATGYTTSCNYANNPINGSGIALLDTTNNCTSKGRSASYASSIPISFIFGNLVPKQTAPIINDGVNFVIQNFTGINYNPLRYITEIPIFCNDENTTNGDGCDQYNQVESKRSCSGNPSICIRQSINTGNVNCDDGNTTNGDGCDEEGNGENGYICAWTMNSGANTLCIPISGVTGYTNNYIDEIFWNTNPSDHSIIASLFASGSAYTKIWNTKCNIGNITKIIRIKPGLNNIPNTLSGNTIYILSSGNHIISYTGGITFGGSCSTLIGQGDSILYSTGNIPVSYGMIFMDNRSNNIVDNIAIKGRDTGVGGLKTANQNGIFINGSSNNTIVGAKIYDNTSYGIYLLNSNYINIQNNIIGNNNYGIYIFGSFNNVINNSVIFSSTNDGILINSSGNSINNSAIINNRNIGINTTSNNLYYPTNNAFNNILIANNQRHGIALTVQQNYINNATIFNNDAIGIYFTNMGNILNYNKSYGFMNIGENALDLGTPITYQGTIYPLGGFFTTGALEFSGLGWSTGYFLSGGIDCSKIPLITNNSGTLTLDPVNNCTNKGKYRNRPSGTPLPIKISFGSNIQKQISPVKYNGIKRENFGTTGIDFDNQKSIGDFGNFNKRSLSYVNPNCDDGNTNNGDGCNQQNQVESGFICAISGNKDKCNAIVNIPDIYTKYLDKPYWESMPSQYNIILSLFGSGSKYTKNWTENCSLENIKIKEIGSGVNSIPQTLSGNTIYLLNPGNYIITYISGIWLDGNCTAIVGKYGDIGIYSTGNIFGSNAMFFIRSKNNIIIDNIKINGYQNGYTGTHTTNGYGLFFQGGFNASINNVYSAYNTNGIYMQNSSNINISNSQTYNNQVGIAQDNSSKNYLNNNMSYNNSSYGIYMGNDSNNNIINNTSSFNNNGHGIYLIYSSTKNSIINSSFFNNNGVGIYIGGSAQSNIIYNTYIYNNNSNGMHMPDGYYNYISQIKSFNNNGYGWYGVSINYDYNINTFFDNTNNTRGGIVGGTEFGYIGWNIGSYNNSGTTNCNEIINIQNSFGTKIAEKSNDCTTRSRKLWTASFPIKSLFGLNVNKQTPLIIHNWNTWEISGTAGDDFNPLRYITESKKVCNDNNKDNNDGCDEYGWTEYGRSCSGSPSFCIKINEEDVGFGCNDGNTINGDGCDQNGLVESGFICSGIPSLCLTFENITGYITGFLTQEYLKKNPSDHQTIMSLFNTGSIYSDAWKSQCNMSSIKIQKIIPGKDTIPKTLSGNTIYILQSGNYIISYATGINFDGVCTALVGSGKTILYSTGNIGGSYGILTAEYKSNIIIDNIEIDGIENGLGGTKALNSHGIILTTTSNSTINNIKSYNNYHGIRISTNSNYITLNKIYTFNNTNGIYIDGISNYSIINNSYIFNNDLGIYLNTNYNSVNNSVIFNNNGHGIYMASASYNLLNNIQVFNNNGNGILMDAGAIQNGFNNISIYSNNFTGIQNIGGTTNKYFGTYKTRDNADLTGITLEKGTTEFLYLGRQEGNKQNEEAYCKINISNVSGVALLDPSNSCGIRGRLYNRYPKNIQIYYTGTLPRQEQPIKYDGISWLLYGAGEQTYFPFKYIGEDSSVTSGFLIEPNINQICTGTGENYNCINKKDIVKYTGFIDSNYWTTNPSNQQIIMNIFSTESAYSKNWRSACKPETINTIYINGGLNTIPQVLSGNTIYILNSGNFIINYMSGIWFGGNCSAIIGKGGVSLFSTGTIGTSFGMLYASGKSNNIIENITINGTSNGLGAEKTSANFHGIYISNSSTNTINNISIIRNGQGNGLYLNTYSNNNNVYRIKSLNNVNGIVSSYSTFNNFYQIQTYNNSANGIEIDYSPSYNIINNVSTYNNLGYGIIASSASYTTINNIDTHNNGNAGLYMNGQTASIIHNTNSYNNNFHGIIIQGDNTAIRMNNIKTYNNNGIGLYNLSSTTKIYGDNYIFDNINNNQTISTGSNEMNILGRDTGNIIYSGETNCLFVNSPINGSGESFLDTFNNCMSRGRNNTWITNNNYTQQQFGLLFSKQIQPIKHNSISYINYGNTGDEYIPIKYIGNREDNSIVFNENTDNLSVCNDNICTYTSSITGATTGRLTKDWRNTNPNNYDIILSLFGSGSKYTENRPNTCNLSTFSVKQIGPGTNTIPQKLTGNTIYILSSGNYIINYISGIRLNGNCSAIIGKEKASIYSSNTISSSYGMIFSNSKSNNIIDNINIDGLQNGLGIAKGSRNSYGILFYEGGLSIINNSRIISNGTDGIYFLRSSKNSISNSTIANNNNYGINIYAGSFNFINYCSILNNSSHGIILQQGNTVGNTINNTYSYNNGGVGIYSLNLQYTTINNSASFNNGNYGIYYNNSSYGFMNNTNSLNNNGMGIYIESNSNYTYINNIISANNNGRGILNNSNTSKYYGYLYSFNNLNNTHTLLQGNLELNYLGWNIGYFSSTGTISCKYFPIPTDTTGSSLLDTTNSCSGRGRNLNWPNTFSITYTYGTLLPKQIQPITNNILSGIKFGTIEQEFNTNKYIGELSASTGTVVENIPCNDQNQINGDGCNTTGFVEDGYLCTGIPSVCKKINTIGYTTGFIDENFWSTSPSTHNIIYSLFGPDSKYTSNRAGYCEPSKMNVITINPGIDKIPIVLSGNTIYVLNSGSYSTYSGITVGGNCTAMIGSGTIRIYSRNQIGGSTAMIYANSRSNTIIDNIIINGLLNGGTGSHPINTYGIYYQNTQSNTFHNISVYNNGSYGIYTLDSANNKFHTITTFNNGHGMLINGGSSYLGNNDINYFYSFNNGIGIYLLTTHYNVVNNIQSYNNTSYGMYINGCYYNSISNSMTYNNSNIGIYIENSSALFIQNILTFNNLGNGIYLQTNANTNNFRNITSANNFGYGILNKGINNLYFGNLNITKNVDNLTGLLQGTTQYEGLGWNIGAYKNNTNFSCSQIIIPENNSGIKLLNYNNNCSSKGKMFNWTTTEGTTYNIGKNTIKQTQPIDYDLQNWLLYGKNGDDFNTDDYITDNHIGTYEQTGDFAICNDGNTLDNDGCSGEGKVENNYTCSLSGSKDFCSAINNTTGVSTNFLNTNYRINNSSDNGIILSLFGSGSAYSKSRSIPCKSEYIRVIDIEPGIDTIPPILSGNTIYFLKPGIFAINYTSGIQFNGNCTALISNGENSIRSNITIGNNYGMLYINGKSNIIIDNIKIDGGTNYINQNKTTANTYGIQLVNVSNLVINNSHSANNTSHGIYFNTISFNNLISNNFIFNNTGDGIYILNSPNITINNSAFFNNSGRGINIDSSSQISINNSAIFNNSNYGIYATNAATLQANNSFIYNNIGYGIYLNSNVSTSNINNISTFNNTNAGAYNAGTNNKIYGMNRFFNNQSNTNVFILGTTELSSIGRGAGSIDSTANIDCNRVINVTNNNKTNLLTGYTCGNTGKILWNASQPIRFAYGINVNKQIQPITNDSINTNIYGITGDDFNNKRFITESVAFGDSSIISGVRAANNSGTLTYYKGSIDIKSDDINIISENIDTGSCEYTLDQKTWTGTIYSGTQNQGYCIVGGINLEKDINISFRIKTTLNTQFISRTTSLFYDNTAPTISFTGLIENYCKGRTFITSTETGVGIKTFIFTGSLFNETSGTLLSNITGDRKILHNKCGSWNYDYTIEINDGLNNKKIISGYFLEQTSSKISNEKIIFSGNVNGSIFGNSITGMQTIMINDPYDISIMMDTIPYNIYNSGLLLMYNFDNRESLGEYNNYIKDLSIYKNDGINNNVKRTNSGYSNGGYIFDGSNQYIKTTGNIMGLQKTASIALRAKIPQQYNNNTQNIIELSSNFNGVDAFIIETNRYGTGVISAQMHSNNGYSTIIGSGRYDDNKRHFILVEFDRTKTTATDQTKIYIDNKEITTSVYQTNNAVHTTNFGSYQVFVGGRDGGVNPLSGTIDELYIFNHKISSYEKEFLFKNFIKKESENNWKIYDTFYCIAEKTHTINITVKNQSNSIYQSGYEITTILPPMGIGTPNSGLNIPKLNISQNNQEVAFDFTGNNDFFWINDTKGYTGWNTTIQLSDDLIGQNDAKNKITRNNIFFKVQSGINVLGGSPTLNISLSSGITNYQALTGVLNILNKQPGPSCNSCIVGTYGVLPSLKINLPSYQVPDTYNGTLIFTLY